MTKQQAQSRSIMVIFLNLTGKPDLKYQILCDTYLYILSHLADFRFVPVIHFASPAPDADLACPGEV